MKNWKLQLTLWYLDQNNCLTSYVFEPDHLFTIFSVPPRTNKGWLAFNIKQSLFDISDESGFSKMIRELTFSKYLDVHHIELYRHRLSIEGEPLYYFAIVGRKKADVPDELLISKGILA